ncbi:MAG: hypothetical protein HY060_16350 [Proteobacteria bacterium]|nr:hypothetical protein [Pseudomonadota bacterium]
MAGRPLGATKVVKTRDKKKLAQIAKILGIRRADPKELVSAELQTRKKKPAKRKSARKSKRG